jgi:hypothetical protein
VRLRFWNDPLMQTSGPLFCQGCIITKSGATDRPPVTDRKRAIVVGTGCGRPDIALLNIVDVDIRTDAERTATWLL